MITVVIPVHNRCEVTLRCLRQLAAQTDPDVSVIVVDDGSTDGTTEAIERDHPAVTVLAGDGELWWAGATNVGVRHALAASERPTHVLLLNDDVEVPSDLVAALRENASSHPRAVIGSLAVYEDDPDRVYWAGAAVSQRECFYGYVERKRVSGCVPADSLPGRGVLFPTEVFELAGLCDERRFPQYWADIDLSWRARAAGFELLCCCETAIGVHVKSTGVGGLHRGDSLGTFVRSFRDRRSPNHLPPMWRLYQKHYGAAAPARFAMQVARVVGGEVLRRLRLRSIHGAD